MKDNSIDLVITSPPYNKGLYWRDKKVGRTFSWKIVGIEYQSCSDAMPRQDYVNWQKRIISECVRILKPSGSLFYNHKDVFVDDNLVGVLQYGAAMNPASGNSVVSGTQIENFLELNRMWIDDSAGNTSESQAISCSIRYIKHRYPKVKWIQSFADERCRCYGIVYQACSFSYYGEHANIFWELDGEYYHNINMTIAKDSQRYINNVGGQNIYKRTRKGQLNTN